MYGLHNDRKGYSLCNVWAIARGVTHYAWLWLWPEGLLIIYGFGDGRRTYSLCNVWAIARRDYSLRMVWEMARRAYLLCNLWAMARRVTHHVWFGQWQEGVAYLVNF